MVIARDLERLYRPNDRELSKAILRELGSRSATNVLFGGIIHRSQLRITEMYGARTRHVLVQQVRIGAGLSGWATHQERPAGVSDYFASREITHEFDAGRLESDCDHRTQIVRNAIAKAQPARQTPNNPT